jgi:PmbA protein
VSAELLDVARDTVRRALARGADQAEVFARRTHEARVQLESDDVSTARSDEEEGYGIRVRVAGSTGFASTNDPSRDALDEAIDAAVALARVSPADPHDDLAEQGERVRVAGLFDPELAQVEVDAVARSVGELAKQVKELDARVRIDSCWISLGTAQTALATSTGIELEERSSDGQTLLMGMAVDGEKVGSFDHEVIDVCTLAELERETAALPDRVSRRATGLELLGHARAEPRSGRRVSASRARRVALGAVRAHR